VDIPLSLAIVVGCSAAAVGVLLLVRHRSPHGGHFGDTSRASGVFSILATSFAVLFAFVVFFAFGSFDRSSASAETEAQVAAQQFETAKLLPESVAPELQAELRCYARSVVAQEWPAMARGEVLGLNRWDTALFVSIEKVATTNANEDAAYAEWLDQRSQREEARNERTLGEEGVIPAPLWFVMLIGGGIVWGFVFLFADRGEGAIVQSVLIGTVTAMLVSGLLLILFLDQPYQRGAGSLKSTAMEQSLVHMDELTRTLQLDLPDVCDEQGNPR
jgi:hypothetical protein